MFLGMVFVFLCMFQLRLLEIALHFYGFLGTAVTVFCAANYAENKSQKGESNVAKPDKVIIG